MVTRFVPRYAGTQAAAGVADQHTSTSQQNQQTPVLTPEDILRRAHANSIAGVIDQISQVAAHALDIFTELRADSDRLSERFGGLVDRVDTLAAVVLDGDVSAKQRLPTEEVSDRVLHVPELSFMAQPHAMSKPTQAAYDRCEPLPPFEVLAEFCPDISQYRKKYSNPEFFKEDWMQRETFRQQHAQEQREERRRHRKEQRKSLVQGIASPAVMGSNQNEEGNVQAVGETESGESEKERLAIQQKMKFLNIRSWKERYGTGEGKELLKPPTPRDKQLPPALSSHDDKKKRRSLTRKSLSIVKENEEEAKGNSGEIQPGSPVAVSPAKEDGSEFKAPGSVSKNNEMPVYSGAFMQEIEDPGDDLEDEYSSQQPSSPVYGGVSSFTSQLDEPAVFADQGLSYYDPQENGVPPPPPPPPQALMCEGDGYEEEDSWTTGQPPPPPPPPSHYTSYSQDYEDVDDFLPPPPPPEPTSSKDFLGPSRRGSFVPPPPPSPPSPPPPQSVEQRQMPVMVRMPSLLQELQSKRSQLHHVQDPDRTDDEQPPPPPPPPPGGLLSPRMNLLQQIRAQQLRPVGPPPPRGPVTRTGQRSQSTPHISAPFASSIARILERRNMTAYDSDTSDKSDRSDSGSESDWK